VILALGSVVLLAVVAAIALPFHERIALRRMGLRVMGEVAAALLRVRDPWAGQHGVERGGMPDCGFLVAAAPVPIAARVGRPSWIALESHAAPRAVPRRPEPALATGGAR
jgi:hypothetical protein